MVRYGKRNDVGEVEMPEVDSNKRYGDLYDQLLRVRMENRRREEDRQLRERFADYLQMMTTT